MNRRNLLRNAAYLTGGFIAAPAALALLQSCGSETEETFAPQYFTNSEFRTIRSYIDTLLPRTDTPGGLDVGVDAFIDRLMAITAPKSDNPSEMELGLSQLEAEAQEQYGHSFADLEESARATLFTAAEERSPRYNPQIWGSTVGEEPPIDFYRSFKSMVLWAYLSSETISTEVLNYDPIPGEYDGDVALEDLGGRAWSL